MWCIIYSIANISNKIFIVPMYAGDFQSFTMFFLPHVLLFSVMVWLCYPIFTLLAGYIPGTEFHLRCGVLRQKQQDTPPYHVLSKRSVLYPLQCEGHLLWGTRTHRKISEEKL